MTYLQRITRRLV